MNTQNLKKLVWPALVVLALIAVYFAFSGPKTPETPGTETTEISEEATGTIDVQAALSERVLGNTSAPVKISEHSSFTCGHCGKFHKETFAEFKTNYIDSGKAYLVFSDFPLNAAALHASMTARCLPADRYFGFVQSLFEEQEKWAYDTNYLDYLKLKASENGMPEGQFKACLQNEELRKGIIDRMKAAQEQWTISATPSFVVNNKTVVSGALPYAEFAQKLEAAINPDAQPVVTEPEAATATEAAPAADAPAEAPAAPAAETPAAPATTEAPAVEAPAADAPAPATTPATPAEPEASAPAAPAAPVADHAAEPLPVPAATFKPMMPPSGSTTSAPATTTE